MGRRTDPSSGQIEDLYVSDPSYYRNVLYAFQTTPIAKTFGLTVADAMAMPVDQWYELRDSAKLLKDHEGPSVESRLLDLLTNVLTNQQGGGGE